MCIEEVQGWICLMDFHGLTLTRDELCSLIRKWQTMIEAHADVKTTGGFVVRMFVIALAKRRPDQVETSCYVQTAQIRKIRRRMIEIMANEAGRVQLRELVKKLIPESIGKEIEKQTQGISPLKDVHVRKVKLMEKPKFDITKRRARTWEGDILWGHRSRSSPRRLSRRRRGSATTSPRRLGRRGPWRSPHRACGRP